MPSQAYVSLFNFKGSDQQKRVDQLSGGERNRVHLARMLGAGKCALLDEPTMVLMWILCVHWKRPCWTLPAARL